MITRDVFWPKELKLDDMWTPECFARLHTVKLQSAILLVATGKTSTFPMESPLWNSLTSIRHFRFNCYMSYEDI